MKANEQPAAHPGHHDLCRRRDRERHPLHRARRRGLPAQALQSDLVARPRRRLPRAQTAARPGDSAYARTVRGAGAADGDLRGAQGHLELARRAGAGVPGHAGERHAHLRGQVRRHVASRRRSFRSVARMASSSACRRAAQRTRRLRRSRDAASARLARTRQLGPYRRPRGGSGLYRTFADLRWACRAVAPARFWAFRCSRRTS